MSSYRARAAQLGATGMRILTAEEMRSADQAAIEQWGIPGLVLMENAAIGVVEAICRDYGEVSRILVFCGPGNNGGDGLAIGRHLELRGFSPRLLLVGWSRNRSADAQRQLDICERQGLPIAKVESVDELRELAPEGLAADLFVDALFGTGLARPLEGVFAEAVRWLAGDMAPVLAVDLPSGLDASTGEVIGPSAAADLTVTFAAPKRAHIFSPAAGRCGEIVVTDLGLPDQVLADTPGYLHLLVSEELASLVLEPSPDDHKGHFGHCLIVAGSKGKGGAAILAARAAVRGGAGLVTVAVPEPLWPEADSASLESMTLALSSDRSGGLTVDAAAEVLEALAGKSCLALGPGLGTSGTTLTAVRGLAAATDLPLILDADGLNAFVGHRDILVGRQGATILTPHPGEAARLFESSIEAIHGDRIEFTRRQAIDHGLVLVLKGRQTLVATPQGDVYVNPTGNPGMASGGAGDVLTGLIAALVARNYDPVVAACLGVYVHGLAADLALERQSVESLHANDLLDELANAFRSFRPE